MFGSAKLAARRGDARRQRRPWRALAGVFLAFSVVALIAAYLPGNSAAAEQADFTFGTGFAQASLLTPALSAGQLSVPLIVGEAAASYQDESGRATSTIGAVPLLGATTGGGKTCGVQQAGTDIPLPDPLIADTASNNNTKNVDRKETTASGVVSQEVHAKPDSLGQSRTEFADFTLPELAAVHGATATALTTADAKTMTRTSTSAVNVADTSLLGGLIHLKGMHWTLSHIAQGPDARTVTPKVTWSFGIDGITIDPGKSSLPVVGGLLTKTSIPIATPEGTTAAIATANALLERIGVTIVPPTFSDNGQGRQAVSPLQLHVGGPNWILTPVFGQVLSQQEVVALQTELLKFMVDPQNCEELLSLLKPFPPLNAKWNSTLAAAPLLAAASIGVLSGGNAGLSIGGVQAAIDATYYPPLNFGGPQFLVPLPGLPATPEVPGSAIVQRGPRVAAPSLTRSSSRCSSTSPAGHGCWKGLAPLAAGIAAAAAVAMLAADAIGTRRRLRPARNEIA